MRAPHVIPPRETGTNMMHPSVISVDSLQFCFKPYVTSWPGLNRIDRILISTRYTFFSGSSSEKNSRLSVLGLERFDDG
jgi:hypothetical protein